MHGALLDRTRSPERIYGSQRDHARGHQIRSARRPILSARRSGTSRFGRAFRCCGVALRSSHSSGGEHAGGGKPAARGLRRSRTRKTDRARLWLPAPASHTYAPNSLHPEGVDIDLIGTDLSEAMLQIARNRGETVMSLPPSWRALSRHVGLDAAIAVFVLHYGVPLHDLSALAAQLPDRRTVRSELHFKPLFLGPSPSLRPHSRRMACFSNARSVSTSPAPTTCFCFFRKTRKRQCRSRRLIPSSKPTSPAF